MRRCLVLLPATAAVLAVACSSPTPFEVNGIPARSFSLSVGGQLDIQLQVIGPGEYDSPPTLIGATLQFLGASVADGIAVPAGVKQAFHFKGIAAGQTIIVFHSPETSGIVRADIIDTVNVR